MRPQLPTFDSGKVYLMTGRMLNSIMAAIRSIVPRAGAGLEEQQTRDGVQLSAIAPQLGSFSCQAGTSGIRVEGGWYRVGFDGEWIQLDTVTVGGNSAYIEITTDADCEVTAVEIKGGTMGDVTTTTGSPAYVSKSRFLLCQITGTGSLRLTQFAEGNLTLIIADINGYAARWPAVQGGIR